MTDSLDPKDREAIDFVRRRFWLSILVDRVFGSLWADGIRTGCVSILATALSLFTIYEVSYGLLPPTSQLAVFGLLGLSLCLLMNPIAKPREDATGRSWLSGLFGLFDVLLVAAVVFCCGYVVWEGTDLANRAGRFTDLDLYVAIAGTLLVLEATRRSIGWALPILAGLFVVYGLYGPNLPDWLLPHRGYGFDRIAAQSYLGSLGVFGIAMRVMFTYVFLFVVFGAFLEMSGATGYIIDFAEKVFGRSAGGPAKVSVLGSGLMGSLSGSAVANAVTTGTFTIPMMRNAGFAPHVAGGITAAAASGGALVPPVMGAGAYMMLELVEPQVTFLEIAKAAIVPAVLYYLSILLIVHFYAKKVGTTPVTANDAAEPSESKSLLKYEGLVFFGALTALIVFLIIGYTPFRAVTYSLEVILVLTILSPRMKVTWVNRLTAMGALVVITTLVALVRTNAGHLVILNAEDAAELGIGEKLFRWIGIVLQADQKLVLADWTTWADAAIPGMVLLLLAGLTQQAWRGMIHQAFMKSAMAGVSLVSASACVGIIIGVVSLTGAGTAFPAQIVPLAEQSLFLALVAIMLCSIVLGMGLPSAVCYLLMATLIGPVLNQLGVIPLAAHLFIFYFGMMSMVTPPVALAAYASASIADAKIMPTGMAAFRFSLVGFTLPFMFVYRPELLLLSNLPIVTPEFVNADKVAVGESAEVTGNVARYGQIVEAPVVELGPESGGKGPLIHGRVDGSFSATLSPGRYLVRQVRPDRIGSIVVNWEESDGGDPEPRIAFESTLGGYEATFDFVDRENVGKGRLVLIEGHIQKDGQPVEDAKVRVSGAEWTDTDSEGTIRAMIAIPSSTETARVAHLDGLSSRKGTLGTLVFDPTLDKGEGATDGRIAFIDGRLSLTTVVIQIGIAVIGIVALAAGIAGFLFTEIRPLVRVAMLAAAALLLSPDVQLGGFNYGLYANLVGVTLFAVTIVVNFARSRGTTEAPQPA